jgi:hypothetical protein
MCPSSRPELRSNRLLFDQFIFQSRIMIKTPVSPKISSSLRDPAA